MSLSDELTALGDSELFKSKELGTEATAPDTHIDGAVDRGVVSDSLIPSRMSAPVRRASR